MGHLLFLLLFWPPTNPIVASSSCAVCCWRRRQHTTFMCAPSGQQWLRYCSSRALYRTKETGRRPFMVLTWTTTYAVRYCTPTVNVYKTKNVSAALYSLHGSNPKALAVRKASEREADFFAISSRLSFLFSRFRPWRNERESRGVVARKEEWRFRERSLSFLFFFFLKAAAAEKTPHCINKQPWHNSAAESAETQPTSFTLFRSQRTTGAANSLYVVFNCSWHAKGGRKGSSCASSYSAAMKNGQTSPN